MLNVDNTPRYLIDRGLMTVQSILDADLIVSSAMRRNRNLRVKRKHDPSYLLKQPDDPSSGAQITLRNEAAFYTLCQEDARCEALREFLPRLRDFDPQASIVVLELLEDARPLAAHYSAYDGKPFPTAAARAAGRALATLHRTFRTNDPAAEPGTAWLHQQPPWIMRAHKPTPELLASLTPANAETIRILQTEENLSRHLDQLRRQWQPSTVLHNDIKSDNVLVLESDDAIAVKLVDWELVSFGDPAWDIAGMLQDFILFWVSSMPFAGVGVPPAAMVASGKYKLPDIHTAIRAFWGGYREAAALERSGHAPLLARAVAFSAARLIQSAYELGQAASMLAPASVLLLQISANVLREPARAQVELYGLLQGASA